MISQSGGFHFELEGAAGLDKLFAAFDNAASRKGMRWAVRDAHKVVFDAVRAHIERLSPSSKISEGPSLRSRMIAALKLRVRRRNPVGTYAMDVKFVDSEAHGLVHYPQGASSSLLTRKTTGRRTFIPAALEFGHGSDKASAARPFMAPAVDASQSQCNAVLSKRLREELDRLVREHAR